MLGQLCQGTDMTMDTPYILLIEDNPADVCVIRFALAEHHVAQPLHVIQDGEAAVKFMVTMGTPGGNPCPDLLLLDLNLPKAGGDEILSEFRKHPECARTPVIIVSSSDAAVDRRRVAALGISCYFRKPSDLTEYMKLGGIVEDAVSHNGTG
jgi:chemotaxis family two-component system response regulator Rcp1